MELLSKAAAAKQEASPVIVVQNNDGSEFKISSDVPEGQPVIQDRYLTTYWEQGVHKLVEMLNHRDREIAALRSMLDIAVKYGEKKNRDYWELLKKYNPSR